MGRRQRAVTSLGFPKAMGRDLAEADRSRIDGRGNGFCNPVEALKEKPQVGLGLPHFEMERNNYAHATCHPDFNGFQV